MGRHWYELKVERTEASSSRSSETINSGGWFVLGTHRVTGSGETNMVSHLRVGPKAVVMSQTWCVKMKPPSGSKYPPTPKGPMPVFPERGWGAHVAA